MESLKDSALKRELIIKPWDDVVTELLTNEDAFNQISKQLDKFESVLSESLKRIVILENENGKLQRTVLDANVAISKYQRAISNLEENLRELDGKVKILSIPHSLPANTVEMNSENIATLQSDTDNAISKQNSNPITEPTEQKNDTTGVVTKTSTPIQEQPSDISTVNTLPIKHMTPIIEPQSKCISPVVFTHNLSPVFHNQRSLNSKGVATFKDGIWEIQMLIDILEAPSPGTIGYINYLNNQVPVGFSPVELININTDKNGVYVEADKVILGYITYIPDVTSIYPHTLGITMMLK